MVVECEKMCLSHLKLAIAADIGLPAESFAFVHWRRVVIGCVVLLGLCEGK